MDIRFRCSECGQLLAIDAKYAGRMVKCKRCDVRIQIPEVESSSELIRDEPVEEEKKPDLTWADLICIRTYDNREEAEFVRGFLEANEIRADVFADDCGGWRPGLHSSEGLRLMAAQTDAERALQLLKQIDEGE